MPPQKLKPSILFVKIPDDFKLGNFNIRLILKSRDIILPAFKKKDDTYAFNYDDDVPINLPVGEEAIILATTYRNNIPYFAFQKIIIAPKQNINLSLKETTKLKLEAYLKENI
jgi:hypothetical protein